MKLKENRVWSKFTKTVDGKEIKLRVQEASIDQYNVVLDLFMKYHSPEEPLRVIAGVTSNPTALQEFRDVMLDIMIDEKQEILICCIDDDDTENLKIVGAQKMCLIQRKSKSIIRNYHIKTRQVQNFFNLRNSLYATYDVLKEHNSENAYFADRGLVVDPIYRGLGIAESLMLARAEMLRKQQVTLYSGLATAIGTQKIAANMGATTVKELDLKEYAKIEGLSYNGGPLIAKIFVGRIPS